MATVDDYFSMLANELRGDSYSKAAHWRLLMPRLKLRTKGSVEFKYGNISAVLRDLGFPWIEGYKPYSNYQGMLADVVRSRLVEDQGLQRLASQIGKRVPPLGRVLPLSDPRREVGRPERRMSGRATQVPARPTGARFDFAHRDAENRRLGELGERFVLEVERARLRMARRDDLAKKVVWTSKEIGDGTGFDIESFTTMGGRRLLEVKTTNYNIRFPFVVSRNEIEVSERHESEYAVVRVFDFHRDPRFFVLPGAISKSCSLEPRSYSARP